MAEKYSICVYIYHISLMAILGGLLKVPKLLELHELGSHARCPTPRPVLKLLGARNSLIPSDEGVLGVMLLKMRP